MEELPILNIAGGILMYFAKILILIAAIIAVFKRKTIGSILLLAGIVSIILGDVVGTALLVNAGREGTEEVVKITGVNAIISAVSHLLFATGLLIYVIQSIRQNTKIS